MGFKRRSRAFLSKSGGSISIMMGLVLLMVVGAVGGAVDLSNAMRQRMIAQHSLDAALLSTFRGVDSEDMTAAQRENLVRGFMGEALDGFPEDARVAISQENDTYTAQLDFRSDNRILKIVGYDAFAVDVASKVTFAPPPPLELSLVLDTTSSMAYRDKLPTMKAAARDLVTTLTEFDTVSVALVPFSQHINVGMANRNAAGLDIPEDIPDTQSCTSTPDMAQSNCRSEATTCSTPSCSTYTDTCTADGVQSPCSKEECRPGQAHQCNQQVCDQTPTGTTTTTCQTVAQPKWRGCVGSREYPANTRDSMVGGPVPGFLDGICAQPIVRLTKNKASVIGAIDGLTTNGETFIAPALLWGKRMIGTSIPFPDGSTDPTVRKAIVLMSDGANTISKNAGTMQHTGTSRADADALLLEVCTGIKEQDITLITVAYDIDDAAGRQLLKDCASPGAGMFFDARTDAQLVDSFDTITRGFRSVRLSQ